MEIICVLMAFKFLSESQLIAEIVIQNPINSKKTLRLIDCAVIIR